MLVPPSVAAERAADKGAGRRAREAASVAWPKTGFNPLAFSLQLSAEGWARPTRAHEIGVRVALGAMRSTILRMFLESFGHGGISAGVNADLRIVPRLGYVVIGLSNFDYPAASRLVNFFLNRMPAT